MKNLLFLLSFIFVLSTQLMAQTIMNIHQSNGTVLQIPVNTIDSITYSINNPGNLASITTTAISSNTGTSAVSGGNITNSGGSLVTSRGVCWSASPNPTTANNITANGSGTGSFTSTLTGLTANTTYYVRAYAINSAGTAYGNQVSFTAGSSGGTGTYPSGSVFCNGSPTAVVDVINPATGKTWMDRNLGASRAATSSADSLSFGDLYQWGRRSDGHQCRNSSTISTLSSTDQPAPGSFILAPNTPYDWRGPQNNNLWQGVNGVNNPCPSGYRLPTDTELDAERLSWSSNTSAGAFASPLKLPIAGYRNFANGSLFVGTYGDYWSSTVSGADSHLLRFFSSSANIYSSYRAHGHSVRCIKN